jgi:hypothetical protein
MAVTNPADAQGWHDLRDLKSFVVHADFSTQRLSPLLGEIVQLSRDVRRELLLDVPPGHIADIYLFADRGTYQRYLRRFFPKVPKRRAMFVKSHSPGNVFAYASRELHTDLRHEYTHAVLHAALPYVPLWLDEGLAEYFEVAADDRARGNPHLATVRRLIRWRRPLPISELENIGQLEDMQAREYRDAWAWVHFLLHGPPEGRLLLQRYLTEIANQRVPAPLSERLPIVIPDADRIMRQHFLTWR